MSTGNFSSPNGTDGIYAFCMETEDDDIYDIVKDNVVSSLKSIGFSKQNGYRNNDESYIAKYDFEVYDLKYKERSTVEINCYIESGYYDGARLDYEVIINADRISKTNENKIERIKKKVNKIFKENSIQLKVTARFSNGETWYAKA